MKKIALMMTVLAVCLAASGQDVQPPFFPEGTTWVEKTTNIIENTYRYDTYLVGGDTVIGGETYRKLSRNGVATDQSLREDGGKVYAHDASFGREFLLYDFDWSVGKELVFEYAEPDVEPMRIEISEIGQMRLSDGSSCDYVGCEDGDFLLRGIGCSDGVLTHAYMQPTNGDRKTLYSFTRGGKLLYQYKADAFDCKEAYWVSYLSHGDTPDYLVDPSMVVVYRLRGDTIAYGETWQVMRSCVLDATDVRTISLDAGSLDYDSNGAIALMRKDGEKVYCVVLKSSGFVHETYVAAGEPFLLYDFGAGEGETFYSAPTDNVYDDYGSGVVMTTGKEVFLGVERTVINGSAAEGIGCLQCSPLGLLQMYVTGENPHLLSCIVDGQLVYEDCPDNAPWLAGVNPCMKLSYDMIAPTSYTVSGGNTWVIGRVSDGKVVSAYEIGRTAGAMQTDVFRSDMLSGKDVVITKPVFVRNENDGVERFPDLTSITIDGVTRTLYDFSLDEGEVFDNGVVRLEVADVDTAYFEGYERRVLTMGSGEQWIDGIGSTRGLLAPVTEPTEGYEEVLLSFRSGDVVMYVNPVYGSGIGEQPASTASAYVCDGTLHVTAATVGEHSVSIVAMDGTEVVRTAFTGTSLSLQLPDLPRGVYAIIVADGNEVACRAKVVM